MCKGACKNLLLRLACAGVAFFTIGCASKSDAIGNEEIVRHLVAEKIPGSQILRKQDIDQLSCKGYGELSSVVASDLNDDSYVDYIALLTSDTSHNSIVWNDRKLKETKILVIAFISMLNKGYDIEVLESIPAYLPTNIVFRAQPVVFSITENQVGEMMPITNSGISRINCEKSEIVYYWADDIIKMAVISD